ncbi:MAG: hypothetical protein HQ588_02595 [Deltaproteobacteria bacterium]|nr:hypothetical protein [Deltaproteobacteria bacterium]
MSLFNQLAAYWRLGWGLKAFLREPVTLEQSREIVKQGLQNREQNLLAMVKRAIYDNAASPYLKLLELAGCEYADLEKMVRSDGIEPALRKLREAGVYITIEEFKGKKEVVRSGKAFRFKEDDFNNPFLVRHFEASSSASRGTGTRVMMNFDRYYYHAAQNAVAFDAYGILGSPVLLWMPILPSTAGLPTMFRSIKMGNPPVRWFSPVAARTIRPSLTKRLAIAYAVYAGRLFGATFARPEYVSLEQADKVAACLVELLQRGRGCVLWTLPSSAVRVCQAAVEGQLDLSGATFAVAGEPLTEAKTKEISAVGARAINMYASAEVGIIGFGCAGQTAASDDIHLLMDFHAVIQHRRETPFGGASVNAFLFTSLLSKAPKMLLNVESGDHGVIETRHCGCALEELGLTDHLYNIRSFDKLTGEGMSFVGTDLLRIIEEVLPAKFGGASTDYQMVEDEDERAYTSLSVLVSPEVGEIDEAELVKTILAELSKGKDTQRMMAEMWSQADMLRVKRMRPIITAAGKLLPLHIQKVKTKE